MVEPPQNSPGRELRSHFGRAVSQSRKRYLYFFLFTVFAATFVSIYFLRQDYLENKTSWIARLSRIEGRNDILLQRFLKGKTKDLNHLASLIGTGHSSSATGLTISGIRSQNRTSLAPVLAQFAADNEFSAIYVLDGGGKVLAQSNNASLLPNQSQQNCQASSVKTVLVAFRAATSEYPDLIFTNCLPPASMPDGLPACIVGVVPARTISSIFFTDTLTTTTGETLLVGQNGPGHFAFIFPPRQWHTASIFPNLAANAVSRVALQERRSVVGNYVDYRQVPIIAVAHYLPELDWAMVTKIDRSEVLESFWPKLTRALILLPLRFVFVGFLIWGLWRYGQARLLESELAKERELHLQTVADHQIIQQERDRLSALINSIGDEIWFANTAGEVTLANPAALKEFGYGSFNEIEVSS